MVLTTATVGVPLMVQLLLSRERPDGKAGVVEQEVAPETSDGPLPYWKVMLVIAWSTLSCAPSTLGNMGLATTVMLISLRDVPAEEFAYTVYVVVGDVPVGVPLMVHVPCAKDNPAGRAGFTEQVAPDMLPGGPRTAWSRSTKVPETASVVVPSPS